MGLVVVNKRVRAKVVPTAGPQHLFRASSKHAGAFRLSPAVPSHLTPDTKAVILWEVQINSHSALQNATI